MNYWVMTVPVPNTHRVHCVRTRGPYHLLVGHMSTESSMRAEPIVQNLDSSFVSQTETVEMEVREEEEGEGEGQSEETVAGQENQGKAEVETLHLSVGLWVMVLCEGTEYPGEVFTGV